MTIYLYVKTHRKTGLKYLGKTVSKDPYKYRGSGNYWRAHIKKHGYDVDTEILHECQSNEEVREWGLHYSQLWDVVNARDEHGNKIWANLREEAGDGLTSDQSRHLATKRVEDGTHPFLDGEIARQRNLKRVKNGTHHFCGGKNVKQRVSDGTHHLLGGEINRRRVEDGTHPFLGDKLNKRRIEDGTHNFLTSWTCAHCNKCGKSTTNFIRWHKDGKCLTRK